jgi:hypothetical protein
MKAMGYVAAVVIGAWLVATGFGELAWLVFGPTNSELESARQDLARKGYLDVEITGLALCADGVAFRARDWRALAPIESELCAHDETVRTWYVMSPRPAKVPE